MAFLWLLAGIAFALACLVLLLPWLRTIPGLGSLLVLPWQAGIVALVLIAILAALYAAYRPGTAAHLQPLEAAAESTGAATDSSRSMSSLIGAADALRTEPGAPTPGGPMSGSQKANAGSMNTAIASLQARLAKGGGSADDWELLAKSYEFLGRPEDASKARTRQLPALPPDQAQAPSNATTGTAGGTPTRAAGLSGEITIAPTLRAKAAAGATLFIVAKSVDSPGPPVAVLRTTVGSWPLKFTLDDGQSMLPGRNLSSLPHVTVEARISSSGQPLPSSGDLQGSSGAVDAAARAPLNILIDRVVP